MDTDAERQDSVVDAAGDLIETYRDLLTVRIVEHTSMGASISIVGLITLLIIVFVLAFGGLILYHTERSKLDNKEDL
jgi:hypothetical protein